MTPSPGQWIVRILSDGTEKGVYVHAIAIDARDGIERVVFTDSGSEWPWSCPVRDFRWRTSAAWSTPATSQPRGKQTHQDDGWR